MNKLWLIIFFFIFHQQYYCCESPELKHDNHIVCIFDRETISNTIPSGKLFALMGVKEVCKSALVKSLREKKTTLVALHVLQNLYSHMHEQKKDSSQKIKDTLQAIYAKTKESGIQCQEIIKGEQWLQEVKKPQK